MSVLKGVLEHAKRHVNYPTTKKALVEACNNFSDVPREDKDWFEKNLPERGYSEPIEVLKALLDKV
jgi:hypothetical protein